MHFAKWRNPIWKDYMLCNSSCMTEVIVYDWRKRHTYKDSKKIIDHEDFKGRGKGWVGIAQGRFRIEKAILKDASMATIWYYIFAKICRTLQHSANYGL